MVDNDRSVLRCILTGSDRRTIIAPYLAAISALISCSMIASCGAGPEPISTTVQEHDVAAIQEYVRLEDLPIARKIRTRYIEEFELLNNNHFVLFTNQDGHYLIELRTQDCRALRAPAYAPTKRYPFDLFYPGHHRIRGCQSLRAYMLTDSHLSAIIRLSTAAAAQQGSAP